MYGVCIGFDNPYITPIWPCPEAADSTKRRGEFSLGRSRFAHYFEPIFPLMKDLFWFAHGWQASPFADLIFEPGGEERLARYQVDHPRFDNSNASILRPGCLPELANWLRDDWINLLGFIPGSADPAGIADELFEADECGEDVYYTAVEKRVTLCFFCVDGLSWECYSNDRQAVTRVFEHVGRMDGVGLERAYFMDRGKR
jgi:hypothetical protein